MKSRFKKLLALLLAALVAVSAAACGGGASNETGQENPSNAPEQEGLAETAGEENPAEEEAASAEPTPMTILTPAIVGVEDFNTNEFTLKVEEELGFDLTFETIPDQGREEKFQIILASNDLPDVMMSMYLSNPSALLSKYGVDEEMLLPLDDLLEENAPNMLAAAENFSGGLDTLRMIDGKIYSMPVFDNCTHCEHNSKMWIYEPWLNTLGLEMPETTDEFAAMLQAFKDGDPNGNGLADEIPLTANSPDYGWASNLEVFLLNSFVYFDRNNHGFYVEDGVVKSAMETDEFKEGLKYLNSLHQKGLIYENAMTQDNASLVKQVENPEIDIVGAVPSGHIAIFASLGGERGSGFRPLTPLKGPAGYQNAPRYSSYPTNGQYMISVDYEYPERAVQFADALYQMEYTLDICAGGMEGDFWRQAEAGEVGFDGNPAKWSALKPFQSADPQNKSWLLAGVWDFSPLRVGQAADTSIDLWSAEGGEYMLYKTTVEQYVPYARDFSLPPLQYELEDQEQVTTLRTQLKTYMDTNLFNFIFGVNDIDATWEDYLSDLKVMTEPLLQYYQAAYDRQYK